MCEKCVTLDEKIQQCRQIADNDQFTIDALESLAQRYEAEKLALHRMPEPNDE